MMNRAFKNICDFGEKQGLRVFGAVKVQCPVWVLHLKMKIKDDDPFFPVDKAILSYIEIQPDINVPYFSNLIGMDKDFVKFRIKELQEMTMLLITDDGHYYVSEHGKNKYFSDDGDRPEKTVYGDLVLDGLSLRFLDKDFYAARALYSDRRSKMIVPAIVNGPDDPILKKPLERLEKLTATEKEGYLLDRSSHAYEVDGCELKSIDNVYVVFSYDPTKKEYRRDVFFKNRFIPHVDSLEPILSHYYLSIHFGVCHSSEGYEPKPGDPFTLFAYDSIKEVISARYQLDKVEDSYFKYEPSSKPAGGYPLTFNITEQMLEKSKEPSKIMGDALAGYYIMDVKEGSNAKYSGGFLIIKIDNQIQDKLTRYQSLKDYVKKNGHIDMLFIEQIYPNGKSWRREFVELGLLEELEDLDIQKYISNNLENDEDYE